ncbi:MAG: hypothetical protein KJO20_05600 [Eudoraea sp.]|nr:hypothetical protein [Eudoraea sp.]NNK30329.1 hypothetical protein [Flavobacteriaceae bacterium]
MNLFWQLLSLGNQEIFSMFLRKARFENGKVQLPCSLYIFYASPPVNHQEISPMFLKEPQSENTKRSLPRSLYIFYAWLRSPASWDRP